MIRPVKGGFKLYSTKTGKPLSRTLPSRAAAKKREDQVKMFKAIRARKRFG